MNDFRFALLISMHCGGYITHPSSTSFIFSTSLLHVFVLYW